MDSSQRPTSTSSTSWRSSRDPQGTQERRGRLAQHGRHDKEQTAPTVGIPWRVALALHTDGWYLRSDVLWHRPNGAPEGVFDRPHKAHEYIFLLSKSRRYYFDLHAVREGSHHRRSVWTIPIRRGMAKRTTVYPDELAKVCILASTKPGVRC